MKRLALSLVLLLVCWGTAYGIRISPLQTDDFSVTGPGSYSYSQDYGDDVAIRIGSSSATRYEVYRDSATGRLMIKTAETGAAMTDTDGLITILVANGGTLDIGQRVLVIKDDSNVYAYIDENGTLRVLGDVEATSFVGTGADNTYVFNVCNSTHPDSADLEPGDMYCTYSDNTVRISWDGNSPGTSIDVMSYPGAGIAVSTGAAWGTSKTSPTGDIVGTSDTQTFTNKTLDANATGNVLKQYGYLVLDYAGSADSSATYQTDGTSGNNHQVLFSNSADKANNCAWYYTAVPYDIDTAVDIAVMAKIRLGGIDTATHQYTLKHGASADSQGNSANMGGEITLSAFSDPSANTYDIETVTTGYFQTMTGWKSSVTAGYGWTIVFCRDGDSANDVSTTDSYTRGLVIRYGRTQ